MTPRLPALVLLLSAIPGVASAQWMNTPIGDEPPPAPAIAPTPESLRPTRWYGWQTLIVDGSSLSLAVLAGSNAGNRGATFGYLAFTDFLFGPPIVHFTHGHFGKGLGSFGMRAGTVALFVLGIAAALGTCGIECHPGESNNDGAAYVLFGLGLLAIPTTIAVDAAVLAREPVVVGTAWTPRFGVTRHGATLGVAGAFLAREHVAHLGPTQLRIALVVERRELRPSLEHVAHVLHPLPRVSPTKSRAPEPTPRIRALATSASPRAARGFESRPSTQGIRAATRSPHRGARRAGTRG